MRVRAHPSPVSGVERLSGFKELVETPALAAEVTIQPVDELDVDAAIIFSDILVIPEAMGLPYDMIEKEALSFRETIRPEAILINWWQGKMRRPPELCLRCARTNPQKSWMGRRR